MPWETEFWTEHMREMLLTDVMRWLPRLGEKAGCARLLQDLGMDSSV
jgi:hypothetical protein